MLMNNNIFPKDEIGLVPISGEYSNSPLIGHDFKVVCSFDWFKFSTDRIRYCDFTRANSFDSLLKHPRDDIILNEVCSLLRTKKPYHDFDLILGRCEKGYLYGITLDEGQSISFHGPKTKNDRSSTLFNLSGHGCYHYTLGQDYVKVWYKLFDYLLKNDFTFNRLDIAFDLIGTSSVDNFIQWLVEKIKAGSCRTRYKKNYDHETTSPNGGYSLYLGSPTSSTKIRIYNKNAEKVSKDKTAFILDDSYWRIEIQLERKDGDYVYEFVKTYVAYFSRCGDSSLNEFKVFLSDYLNKYLEVRVVESGKNIKYCPVDERWSNFIGDISKNIVFEQGDKKRNTSIAIKKNWLERSAFKAISQLYLCLSTNDFFLMLKDNMVLSMCTFSDVEKNQIVNYHLENGIYNNLVKDGVFNEVEFIRLIEDLKKSTISKIKQ